MNQVDIMCNRIGFVLSALLSCSAPALPTLAKEPHSIAHPKVSEHVRVYTEPGKFGGWPANHGIWSWGDEILVGFSAGTMKDLGAERHNIDREKPERHLLARSLDGGKTWDIEDPSEKGALIPSGKALHGIAPPDQHERPWQDCPGEINFRGGRDVGYPRTVQRPDGQLVTIYYFHDTPGGDRYIAATIWRAD